MEFLLHNAIADMRGPQFLLVYGVVIVVTLIAARFLSRPWDLWADEEPPPLPADPDPYECAYLAGGPGQVRDAVLINLLQRGYLQLVDADECARLFKGEPAIRQAPDRPDARHLSALERPLFDFFQIPTTAVAMLKSLKLVRDVGDCCAGYRAQLAVSGYFRPARETVRAAIVWLCGALVIGGLGGYKLAVALQKGRTNVGFLVIMGVGGLLLLVWAVARKPISRRGERYLERLKLAFADTKPLVRAPVAGGLAPATAYDPTLPLMIGLFGTSLLASTPFADYHIAHTKLAEQQSASGWAGGCGASSCGGGGCGGGGCGGCGG